MDAVVTAEAILKNKLSIAKQLVVEPLFYYRWSMRKKCNSCLVAVPKSDLLPTLMDDAQFVYYYNYLERPIHYKV